MEFQSAREFLFSGNKEKCPAFTPCPESFQPGTLRTRIRKSVVEGPGAPCQAERRAVRQLCSTLFSLEFRMRCTVALKCHTMLPVPVGRRRVSMHPRQPRRALLPSSAAEICYFLDFVHALVSHPEIAFLRMDGSCGKLESKGALVLLNIEHSVVHGKDCGKKGCLLHAMQ